MEKETFNDRKKLTREGQEYLCRRIAEFTRHKEIVAEIEEKFGAKITLSNIPYYQRHPKWSKIIADMRVEYEKDLSSVSFSSKRKRLEQLERVYEFAMRKGKAKEAIDALKQAKAEVEEEMAKFEGKVNVNHNVSEFVQNIMGELYKEDTAASAASDTGEDTPE